MATATLARRKKEVRAPIARKDFGLGFDERGGPLLAVCALAGGAGASTVAYMLAVQAALESSERILVADTGGPTGGLAALAGVSCDRTLAELSALVAREEPLPKRIYAQGERRLRVLAATPRFTESGDPDALEAVLEDARASHGLSVVDCGTLQREADQVTLAVATHVLWVLPAAPRAVARARAVLEAVVPHVGESHELVLARADDRLPRAGLRELQAVAAERRAPLVLMPHVEAVEDGARHESIIEQLATTFVALGAGLKR